MATTTTTETTHTCPTCGAQEITLLPSSIVSHFCPKDKRSRSKRTETFFVRESPRVPGSWADELSESDQDHLFDMLAEDNLGATYEVV